MLRVLIVDDRPAVRRKLRDVLEAAGMLVYSAETGFEAVKTTHAYAPDAVLLSAAMMEPPILELTQRLHRAAPNAPVIVLGVDDVAGLELLRAGAVGFQPADVDMAALPRMLRGAVRGEAVVSRRVTRILVEYFRTPVPVAPRVSHPALTARESQVLDLIAEGASTAGVAEGLGLSAETVRSHVKSVLRKLGVGSRAEAVAAARRQGREAA